MKLSRFRFNISTILKNSKKNAQIIPENRHNDEPNPENRLYQNNLDAERDFLASFQRDLNIDAMVDALQVDMTVIQTN